MRSPLSPPILLFFLLRTYNFLSLLSLHHPSKIYTLGRLWGLNMAPKVQGLETQSFVQQGFLWSLKRLDHKGSAPWMDEVLHSTLVTENEFVGYQSRLALSCPSAIGLTAWRHWPDPLQVPGSLPLESYIKSLFFINHSFYREIEKNVRKQKAGSRAPQLISVVLVNKHWVSHMVNTH